MGFMDLSDFRAELEVHFGERSLDPGTLDRWTNFGYLELCTGVDFEILDEDHGFNTANGDRDYTGPTTPLAIKLLRNTTQDESLTWTPKEEFFRLAWTKTGTPKRWTRHIDDILVWPTPTAIHAMIAVYKKTPTILSLDTDKTVLQDAWDRAISMLSTYHGYMSLGEEKRAAFWYNVAVNYINSRLTEGTFVGGQAGLMKSFEGGMGGLPNSG